MPGEKLIQTEGIWLSCTERVIYARLLWWKVEYTEGVYKLEKKNQQGGKK